MSTILPQVPIDVVAAPPAPPCGIPPAQLDAIVKAAAELFGTSVVPELTEDPESDESYYRLRMKVVRDVDQVARLRKRWFEILRKIAPEHGHFVRLAVDYTP